MRLCKHLGKVGSEALHFFLEGFFVFFLVFDPDVTTWGEDVVLSGDIVGGDDGAEAAFIFEGSVDVGAVGVGDRRDVGVRQLAMFAIDHRSEFSRVDEERLIRLFLRFRDEP